jgi:hypothetical protein
LHVTAIAAGGQSWVYVFGFLASAGLTIHAARVINREKTVAT